MTLVLSTLLFVTLNINSEVNWMDIRKLESMEVDKPVIIKLYTNWCGWCKKMDKTTFQNQEIVEYLNDNFYAISLNGEDNFEFSLGNQTFTPRTFIKAAGVEGYPTILFLDQNLELQDFQPGYKTANQMLRILKRNTSL